MMMKVDRFVFDFVSDRKRQLVYDMHHCADRLFGGAEYVRDETKVIGFTKSQLQGVSSVIDDAAYVKEYCIDIQAALLLEREIEDVGENGATVGWGKDEWISWLCGLSEHLNDEIGTGTFTDVSMRMNSEIGMIAEIIECINGMEE